MAGKQPRIQTPNPHVLQPHLAFAKLNPPIVLRQSGPIPELRSVCREMTGVGFLHVANLLPILAKVSPSYWEWEHENTSKENYQ